MLAEIPSGASLSISHTVASVLWIPSEMVRVARPTNFSQSTSPLFQPPSRRRWSRSTLNV